MDVIAMETVEADKVKEVVSKEEAVASEEAAKVQAIKADCEADLAEAMPVLDRALKALNTLTKNDITEVKVCSTYPCTHAGDFRSLPQVSFVHGLRMKHHLEGSQTACWSLELRCLRAFRRSCRV